MAMLMVLTVTSSNVKTTTELMEPISSFTLPSMLMKLIWNARSVSARTSAAVFSKALFTRPITSLATPADATRRYHVPTVPGSPRSSSSSL